MTNIYFKNQNGWSIGENRLPFKISYGQYPHYYSIDESDWMAKFISKKEQSVSKRLVFVVGGPYGFSKDVYDRANEKISMSKMTFPHELIRLIFVEQLYRAYTIINNQPYHHE